MIRTCLGLALLTTVMLAPFAGKPFHIDDPIYVRVAEQIRNDPGDFYGFEMNWFGVNEPAHLVNRNPPLLPYYLAAVMWCFGQSEVALHLSLIPAAIGAVLGTYLLARRCGADPLFSALCTLASPFFLISATQVMCETLMTCFWIWAVLLWVRGDQEESWGSIVAGAIAVSLSIMTKFQAISLVPLLFVYSITRSSGRRYSLALAIPVVVLAGYEWLMHAKYGAGHFLAAVAHSTDPEVIQAFANWERSGIALAFTGGALLPVLLCLPWLYSIRTSAALFTVGVVAGLGYALLGSSLAADLSVNDEYSWSLLLPFVLLTSTGSFVIWITLGDFVRNRERQSALLVLWVLGVFLFAAVVNWSVNGRTVLPLVPAAAILISRRLERRSAAATGSARTWQRAALLPVATVALLLSAVDYQEAQTGRAAAAEIGEWCRDRDAAVWFQGHWGFQWYMEHEGGQALDVENPAWESGDVLILPLDNANVFFDHPAQILEEQMFRYDVVPWASLMCVERGAGFYTDVFGPMPFNFGSGYPERYVVQVIVPP